MKNAMKRALAIYLALTLFSAAPVSAAVSVSNIFADTREEMVSTIDTLISNAFNNGESSVNVKIKGEYVSQFTAADGKFAPAEEYLMSAVAINKYKYTEGNDYIGMKMDRALAKVGFTYDANTSVLNDFDVTYEVDHWHETPEESEYVRQFVNKHISGVLAGAATPYEKVKNIHDWIILNYDYSYEDTYNEKSHSAYGLLTNGRGVCSAYTLLFDALCRAAGIPTRIVFSEKTYAVTDGTFVAHCWNMVKLDDRWYHVDVTWDDQPHMRNGIVYNYFLKSSDYFMKNSHLWDDRTDGIGTPYPPATRNHWDAPGGSGSENIIRPVEGSKPPVIESAVGAESSVPEVVEVPEDIAGALSSNSGSAEVPPKKNSSVPIIIAAAAIFCAPLAVVLFVTFRRRGGQPKPPQPAPETKTENPKSEEVSDDSYDSYDGFDS